MDGGVVDLLGGLAAAAFDEFLLHLMRIEARIVDAGVVDRRAPVRHPVGDELGHAGRVLHPDGDGIPEPANLLALADRGAAIRRHLQETVEGAPLVVAELAEDRGQLDGPFERGHDLLHLEVALRRRKPCLVLFEDVAGMAEAGIGLLVIAPLDLAALDGGRVAGVAHIGRVALVAQQRPADILARAGELVIGPEEGEGMVDRHDGQILARHLRDQAPPEAGADHDVIGTNRAAGRDDPLDAPVLDEERLGRRVGEGLELALGHALVDQLAGDRLRPRDDEPGIGVPQAALHQMLLDQREFLLDLGRADEASTGAEGLGGGKLALDLVHAGIVADAGDLEAADPGVMAHLLVEIDGVERRPAGEEIMAGRVAEIGGMGRRADIGRNA